MGIEKVKYFSLFLSFTEGILYTCTLPEKLIKARSSFKDDWKQVSLKGYTIRI